ncbi:MAG: flippase-like domain-containing protein [Bacteroidetes bacterium]|nr:flippase-like domain-containing protein [Bacteroidota bacterium]
MLLNLSKLHKSLNILIRLTIVALSVGFIYWKVFAKGDVYQLLDALKSYDQNPAFIPGLLLVCLLMLINWSVESLKWQQLVNKIEQISFLKAVQSVLSGVTVSIFTPNRTGEFIGRAFILKNAQPGWAVLLTIIGSLSQLLVTILIGTVALAFTYQSYIPSGVIIPEWAHIGMISGILMLNISLILFFFNVPFFGLSLKMLFRKPESRIASYFKVISTLSRKELIQVFLLSTLRYAVFSLQFYLIFKLFGIELPVRAALYIIPLIYLALAVIPTFALSELGVRGSVSLFLIGGYFLSSTGTSLSESMSLGIVLAAALLWIINLAIPAIIGIPFVFKLRFFSK